MDLPTVGDISRFKKKSGFLVKQGLKRKNWKKRYFVLHQAYLYYFLNDKANSRALGAIDLDGAEIKRLPSTFKEYSFAIFTLSRTYYIQTYSQRDLATWMNAVEKFTGSTLLPELKRCLNNFQGYSKSGYIEKQGIKVKNWKTRFFVSYEGRLYYFKGSSTPLPAKGYITYYGRRITRLRTTFKGRPNSLSIETGMRTYYLSCDNEEDMNGWLAVMVDEGGVYKDFQKDLLVGESNIGINEEERQSNAVVNSAIFGESLVDAFIKYEGKPPPVLTATAGFLEKYCTDVEGLLITKGSYLDIQRYKDLFDRGITPDFRNTATLDGKKDDPHSIAGVLMQYIRELPESIISPLYIRELAEEYDFSKLTVYDINNMFELVDEENKVVILIILRLGKLLMEVQKKETSSYNIVAKCANILIGRSEEVDIQMIRSLLEFHDTMFKAVARKGLWDKQKLPRTFSQLEDLDLFEIEKFLNKVITEEAGTPENKAIEDMETNSSEGNCAESSLGTDSSSEIGTACIDPDEKKDEDPLYKHLLEGGDLKKFEALPLHIRRVHIREWFRCVINGSEFPKSCPEYIKKRYRDYERDIYDKIRAEQRQNKQESV